MYERHSSDNNNAVSLAAAIKNIIFVGRSDSGVADRYLAITLSFRKLLDEHLVQEKVLRPMQECSTYLKYISMRL